MVKIDAHHHLWRYNPAVHGWITDEMKNLRRDFMPEDLLKVMQSSGYSGCIAVQASQTEKETRFLIEQAGRFPFIKGVVGWLDLRAENLRDKLDYYSEFPALKGLRHVVQDEPDEKFMLRPDFLNGIGALADYDLAYDLLIFPKQLDAAIQLVQKFPGQRFILDHIAKPLIRNGIMSPWDEKIYKLADSPNVYCKLSGMVTETDWHQWKREDFTPYIDVIFKAFGADRVMIGSDWPVCTLAGSYKDVMGIVEHYLTSDILKKKVLGQNAIKFYELY